MPDRTAPATKDASDAVDDALSFEARDALEAAIGDLDIVRHSRGTFAAARRAASFVRLAHNSTGTEAAAYAARAASALRLARDSSAFTGRRAFDNGTHAARTVADIARAAYSAARKAVATLPKKYHA